ncbi:MAG TPA: hypothetical protein PKJ32_07040 [Piscinibacter sp.]|nr:hypothetical protein [Piscinibacter sp.]HPV80393.1 hypothetical protein [Dermatophilaceae bacterium]
MPRIPTSGLNSAVVAAGMTPGTTYYLSAHSADPGTTGASELSGGGYARQAIVFGTATGGAIANNAAISIPNAGTTAVTHFGVWSASTGGTYLGGFPLASSVTAASISVAAGAVTLTAS